MLKKNKFIAIVTAAVLSLSFLNAGAIAANAATVTITLTNTAPVTDVATGSQVSQAGVVGDVITIQSSVALADPVAVTFNSASPATATAIANPVSTLVDHTYYQVVIPAGATTGAVTLSDAGSAHTGTSGVFQIWSSRTEPYVMPSGHLNITYADLQRMLDQIKIGEAHAARTVAAGALTNSKLDTRAASASPVFPYDVSSANRCLIAADLQTAAGAAFGATGLSESYVYSNLNPWGVRQVDGQCNNITNVTAETPTAGTYSFVSQINDTAAWGSADQNFTRLTPATNNAAASTNYNLNDTQKAYQDPSASVSDPQVRVISNLIADQTPNNPAAVAAGQYSNGTLYGQGDTYLSENAVNATTGKVNTSIKIPNVTPDYNVSAGYNSWFTWFGQFFDHGLDLVPKGGSTVLIPLDQSDPVYQASPGAPNFMILTRAANPGTGESLNSTTPYIDQSQTYGSHPSQNFFLREYNFAAGTGLPTPDGRMLDSTSERYTNLPAAWANNIHVGGTLTQATGSPDLNNGGMPTWRDIKAQAHLLGFTLTDNDAGNIPVVATDQYGKFLPSSTGMPMMLFTNGSKFVWVSGNSSSPINTGTKTFGNLAGGTSLPGQTGSNWHSVGTNHNFINDTMATAVPSDQQTGLPLQPDADSIINAIGTEAPGFYDDESLNMHLVAGDGRINENIGLEAVHNTFHSEHNTLVKDIQNELANNPVIPAAFIAEWSGDRLYQAARFVTQMEYQHMVYDEFARRISPSLPVFLAYDPTVNANITAEFASAVYRLGHSMLTETIPRSNPNTVYDPTNNQDVSLLTGFTNPAQGRLQRPMTVASAQWTGSTIVYTLAAGETVPLSGQIVSITGLSDASFNIADAVVDSSDNSAHTFSISSNYKVGDASASAIDSVVDPISTVSSVASTDGALTAVVEVNDPGTNDFTYTPQQQTAMIAEGLAAQRGNEIDEFTTDAVRNNLLGLPLDLASLNLSRGRDTGLPTLNQFRDKTGVLKPYASWNDYIDALRYIESGVNFLAAYGKHPHITGPVTIGAPTSATSSANGAGKIQITYTVPSTDAITVGDVVTVTGFSTLNVQWGVVSSVDSTNNTFTVQKAWSHDPNEVKAFADQNALFGDFAAKLVGTADVTENASATVTRAPNVDERRARAQDILDGTDNPDYVNFLNGVGGYTAANTGVDDIDLWIGGLAENPFKQPVTPPLLGPTFQYVFEDQMLKEQNGDRFYYLGLLAGTNVGEEIPAQKFTDIIRRNTPSVSAQVPSGSASGIVGLASPGFNVVDCLFSNIVSLIPDAVACAANTLRLDGVGTLIHRGLDNVSALSDASSSTGVRLAGGSGDDHITGTQGNDYLSGGLSGGDLIDGYGGNDIIEGGAGEDLLKGGPGNDLINSGESQAGDIADGGSGSDFIYNANSTGPAISFIGEAGNDYIQGGKNSDLLLEGGEGADWIEGYAGVDLLSGDVGVFGGALGSASIQGGNDILNGGAGNDLLGGDAGDDIFNLGDGVDAAAGGTGFDWANYEGTKRFDNGPATKPSAFVDLSAVNPSALALPVDGIATIEGVSGSAGDDTLVGSLAVDQNIARATGVAGSSTVKVPGLLTGVQAGMWVTGTGIGKNAVIVAATVATVNAVSTTTLDLTVSNTATVNGTIALTTDPLLHPENVDGLTALVKGTPGWTKWVTPQTPNATKWTGGTILLGGAGNNTLHNVAGQNVDHGSAQLHTCIAVTHNGAPFTTNADVACAGGRGYSSMTLLAGFLEKGTLNAGELRSVREIVGTNINVTGVTVNAGVATYTANNSYLVGDKINVFGIIANSSLNVLGGVVTAATPTSFTVAAPGVPNLTSVEAGRAGFYNTLIEPNASTTYTIAPITGTLPAGAMNGYTLRSGTTTDYVYDISAVTYSNGVTVQLAPWISTLTGLTISAGTLAPVFNSAVLSYTASVPTATTTIRVTPTAFPGATILVNGAANASGVASANITLTPGAATTINVSVTSQDGSSTSNYVITVTRLGLTTTFAARTQTTTGISSAITNYNPAFTYVVTSNVGQLTMGTAVGARWPFTITGLAGNQVATITVTTSQAGFSTVTTTTTGTAGRAVALVPLFSTPVATNDGFTVNITNYNALYNFAASVSAGVVSVVSTVGSVRTLSVTGIGLAATATVTVATTRNGSNAGSASVTGNSNATLLSIASHSRQAKSIVLKKFLLKRVK